MRITKVDYVSDYKLRLTFSNKEIKIVDFAEKLKNAKGIFYPLKDLEYFKKVSLDDYQLSICWPNGADVCPDVLYKMGIPIPRKKVVRKKTKTTRSTKRIIDRSKVKVIPK